MIIQSKSLMTVQQPYLLKSQKFNTCFICGQEQANWLLHSKPSKDKKPFFPFLQYQKTPPCAKGLDENGRCLSCNVCYLFLNQQWHTYEFTGTPVLKRLYWLKRPANEYAENNNADNIKNDFSAEDPQAIETNPQLHLENSILRQDICSQQQENKIESALSLCQLCATKDMASNFKLVFTTPQKSHAIPFYPGIVTDHNLLDEEGRIKLCKYCYVGLHKQWVDYEEKSISISERIYTKERISQFKKFRAVSCYLCNDSLSHDQMVTLYCKKIEEKPFYPFLKNLPLPHNGVEIGSNGVTFCCEKCKLFLQQQWKVFQELNVPQEERVYRVNFLEPPVISTVLTQESKILCFICSKFINIDQLKRIYQNSGSNMNLGFLKMFPKNKDTFSLDETGEIFVCISCFDELRQHWLQYRVSLFGESERSYLCQTDYFNCEICKFLSPKIDCTQLNFFPEEKSYESKKKPFFPILNRFRTDNDKKPISVCQLCAANLLCQWAKYEDTTNGLGQKVNRMYNINYYVCYICNDNFIREDSDLIDKNSIIMDTSSSSEALESSSKICVCKNCKMKYSKPAVTKRNLKNGVKRIKEEESSGKEPGMKATATVLPFLNFNMRNQEHGNSTPGHSTAEGSFAAALRKLAQQTPGFPSPTLPRDMRHSPTIKNGEVMPNMIPPPHSLHSTNRLSGTPSIMAPHHMYSPRSDRQDPLLKSPFGRSHELSKERESSSTRRDHGPLMVPSIFQYQERDEHHRQLSVERYEGRARDVYDHPHRLPIVSSSGVILKNSTLKERPSTSIGLVHPQPVRKHNEEENMKSSIMNPINYRDSNLRPLSPTEMQRYAPYVSAHAHQHSHSGSQTSCPVHGHESGGHPHEERGAGRPPVLPFDSAHLPREFLHSPHPRLREEFTQHLLQKQQDRHTLERKEVLPHHAIEEDLRRRGIDYRWGAMPPHILDEHYRRHMLNAGHEHSPNFKEGSQNVYVPHLFYGREHPVPSELYLPHMPGQSDLLTRHPPPISPRLLDYYRRADSGFFEHARHEQEAERRSQERREKERMRRTASLESLKRKNEEIQNVDRKRVNSTEEKNSNGPITNGITKMPIFKGLDYHKKIQKTFENGQQPNSIDSLLNSNNKLPDPKTELVAASILANMNMNCRVNKSPCSDEVESLTSGSGTEMLSMKTLQPKVEEVKNSDEKEQNNEKLDYLFTLGLVTHSKRRVLEDDYERKRWERKFRKFRGRPKKRSKRENTEESSVNGDSRSLSELDFYSGPMTRHKQQLLQEQESLLEQIQKQKSTDSNDGEPNTSNENSNDETSIEIKTKSRKSSPGNSPDCKTLHKITERPEAKIKMLGESKPSSSSLTPYQSEPISDHKLTSSNIILNSYSHERVLLPPEHSGHTEQSRLVNMLRDTPQHKISKQHERHLDRHERNNPPPSLPHVVPLQPPPHLRSHQHQHHSPHHFDHIENYKALDTSVFGRVVEAGPDNYVRWPGIQPLVHAYSVYQTECEAQRRHLLQSREDLRREGRNLDQNKQFLDKDLMVYNERRMRIAEKRRHMHVSMEGLHDSLRTISNL